MKNNDIERQYDFTGAERGKFYDPNAVLQIPVYLESDTMAFVEEIAKRKGKDVSVVVNDLIKADRDLLKKVQ